MEYRQCLTLSGSTMKVLFLDPLFRPMRMEMSSTIVRVRVK